MRSSPASTNLHRKTSKPRTRLREAIACRSSGCCTGVRGQGSVAADGAEDLLKLAKREDQQEQEQGQAATDHQSRLVIHPSRPPAPSPLATRLLIIDP